MLTLSGESAAGFGFFNAYEQLAKADDLDFVVHVGDYIYEVGILPREAACVVYALILWSCWPGIPPYLPLISEQAPWNVCRLSMTFCIHSDIFLKSS